MGKFPKPKELLLEMVKLPELREATHNMDWEMLCMKKNTRLAKLDVRYISKKLIFTLRS